MVNPRDKSFKEPFFHEKDLNNLDVIFHKIRSRTEIEAYLRAIQKKIITYASSLQEDEQLRFPPGCAYTRFTLRLAQYRHLHTHVESWWAF